MSSFDVFLHDVKGVKDPSAVFYRALIHINFLNIKKKIRRIISHDTDVLSNFEE